MRRRHFARRVLDTLSRLGLIAKTLVVDGFTIRAMKLGDIEKARVTAPMGAVVVGMIEGKLRQFVADNWLGEFVDYGDRTACYYPSGNFQGAGVVALAAKLSTEVLTAAETHTTFPNYSTHIDKGPVPSVAQFGIEWPVISINTKNFTTGHWYVGSDVSLYCDTGHDVRSGDFWRSATANDVNTAYLLGAGMGKLRSVRLQNRQYMKEMTLTPTRFFAFFVGDLSAVGGTYQANINEPGFSLLFSMLPGGLKTVISDTSYGSTYAAPVGAHIAQTGPDSYKVFLGTDCSSSALHSAYFSTHLADVKWKAFVSVYDSELNSSVSFQAIEYIESFYNRSGIKGGSNYAFLASYSPANYVPIPGKIADMKLWRNTSDGGDGVYYPVYIPIDDGGTPPVIIRFDLDRWEINWDFVLSGLRQLFPWPNANMYAPCDSSMFYDDDGLCYTWTRRYGVARISADGIFRDVDISLPDTSVEGVRPEILTMGGGNYLCVMRDVYANMIVRVSVSNSLYGGWSDILEPDGFSLLRVEPLDRRIDRIGLIAVVVRANPTQSELFDYFFASYNDGVWRVNSPILIGTDQSPLSTDWALALYGEGAFVKNRSEIPSWPITPQLPLTEYANYSDFVP